MIEICSSRILVWKHHLTSVQIPGGRRLFEGHLPSFPNINFDSWVIISSTPLALKADEYWNKEHLATRSCAKGVVCSPVTNFFLECNLFFLLVTAALYSDFLISFEPILQ